MLIKRNNNNFWYLNKKCIRTFIKNIHISNIKYYWWMDSRLVFCNWFSIITFFMFDQGGKTPLYIAARGSFTAIVDMIIKTARLEYTPKVRTYMSWKNKYNIIMRSFYLQVTSKSLIAAIHSILYYWLLMTRVCVCVETN